MLAKLGDQLGGITVMNAELRSVISIRTYPGGQGRVECGGGRVLCRPVGAVGKLMAVPGVGRQDFRRDRTSLSQHFAVIRVSATRQKSLRAIAVECCDTMMAVLKIAETTAWAGDKLKMSVKTPASCSALHRL